MFLLFIIASIVVGLQSKESTEEIVYQMSINGISLLEYYTPFGNDAVDLVTCARAAIANFSQAYEMVNTTCHMTLPDTSLFWKVRRDEPSRKIYFATSLLNYTECPLEMPQHMENFIPGNVRIDSWSEWSVCDNKGTCGGGFERRRYYASTDETLSIREWEERRLCKTNQCPSVGQTCSNEWRLTVYQGKMICVPNSFAN